MSVEELFDPSLKGKPVVVGGRANQRGVVSAASYAARKFGVHSAMPLRTRRISFARTRSLSTGIRSAIANSRSKVYEVLNRFSPKVEMASIDEAYLDLTGTARLLGPPLESGARAARRDQGDTGLNCSIGIATSRLLAKIASDQAKPNGMLWVPPGLEAAFLAPLEVRKIPGVGKKTEESSRSTASVESAIWRASTRRFSNRLWASGDWRWPARRMGSTQADTFKGEVGDHDDPKSISHEHTFGEDSPMRICWSRRWRSYRRWSAGGCASTRCTRAPFRSSCATRTSRR